MDESVTSDEIGPPRDRAPDRDVGSGPGGPSPPTDAPGGEGRLGGPDSHPQPAADVVVGRPAVHRPLPAGLPAGPDRRDGGGPAQPEKPKQHLNSDRLGKTKNNI